MHLIIFLVHALYLKVYYVIFSRAPSILEKKLEADIFADLYF